VPNFLEDRSCLGLMRMNKWVKDFFAVWIESVMTMIHSILDNQIAWFSQFSPYLIANNSASVNITFVAWCIVLMTDKFWTWMCDIKVAILFLILVSEMIIAELESVKVLKTTSSSFWR